MTARLGFACDYMEGAHPAILNRLMETNLVQTAGYGEDQFSESAREKIREACGCPEAEIRFLVGGTQTNATVIGAFLKSYQGVLAAETGHINVHEAGAIEMGGHKVLPLKEELGKITADQVREYVEIFEADESRDHVVMPGMVYLSQPTEYGTLYSLEELEAMRAVCDEKGLYLYIDGARLAYALACPENDVTMKDLGRLCDAFYIGGTKCGALFGEAVVIPDPQAVPHFFTITKQFGALLAKGRVNGVQFDALFTDGLYDQVGKSAIELAERIKEALKEKGYNMYFHSPTNQIFVIMENSELDRLAEQVDVTVWGRYDESRTVIRLVTSWATTEEAVDRLIEIL